MPSLNSRVLRIVLIFTSVYFLRSYLNISSLLNTHPPTFNKPNPFNLFTDLHHASSFYLFSSSNLSVSPHLLLFLNSSIRHRPSSPYPPTMCPSFNSLSLLLILLSGDVQLNPGPPMLNFTHLNIHSLATKSAPLHNYLISHPTDILSLNETLLQPTDSDSSVASFIPPSYSILHSPRLTGLGSGVAVIFRQFLKLTRSKSPLPSPISFETMTTKLTSGNKETIFINIYRRPPSPLTSDKSNPNLDKNKLSTFFSEFQALLEHYVPLPSELIITLRRC